MPKSLTSRQVQQYEKEGYLYPLPVLSADEVGSIRQGLEKYLTDAQGLVASSYKHKLHLVSSWADALVHNPKILDAVEDVLGPDILCWTTNLLYKPARHPKFVSWHQDSGYWGLEPHEVVTAWVALSPSTKESGCVQVMPGSHLEAQAGHRDTFHKDNMLSRGQELDRELDEEKAVNFILAPGEISLHHIKLIHGSKANESNQPRIGVAIRYMSANVLKMGARESALLVRGRDRHGYFLPEQRPDQDFGLAGRLAHNRAVRKQVVNNFSSEGKLPFKKRIRLGLQKTLSKSVLDLFYCKWKLQEILEP